MPLFQRVVVASGFEHVVYGTCQGHDRRAVLAVRVLLCFCRRVWTWCVHLLRQVAPEFVTDCAHHLFHLALCLSLVKIWDAVNEGHSVVGEYKVLTGRVSVLSPSRAR